jgi:hypothetical protein
MTKAISTSWFVSVDEHKQTLFNALRAHPMYAERWRNNVIESYSPNDDHDPDMGGVCNFEVGSMTEFRELLGALDTAKIRRWHIWVSIESANGLTASAGLGFRSDGDIMGDIRVDWKKLNDHTRTKVQEAIATLESVL